ncbi:hypothetical protein JOD29_001727 [Lysinibacillus composti]|uniref:Lipoprotein n=1 Tax=Lysinibacillus composti TaxID=720633 RepID=A0A3N9UES3_9BACI|nr:hypothetical protein [Lysinibacillus composti]MBM7608482.1 hypothetical protein [Lysinibacillus composti]RQW74773.1 hypothetical protein EBB45_09215 [Lysinibacillus composti]
MKKMIGFIYILVLGILLAACSEKEGQLTRVDVQEVNKEGNKEEVIIVDQESLQTIKKSLEHVRWEPNTEVSMARREDVIAILFYTIDENMPESLVEHQIWFEVNGSATIISNHEDQGYGRLDQEHAQNLKNAFIK